jgi:type I restriction enzyme, S subunit
MDVSFRYINKIKFSSLNNWSVSHLLEETFSYNKAFPLVKIGKFLNKNTHQTIIENDKVYKRVTVKINNNGVMLRDTAQGNKIGIKRQFLVKEGQFIISKIDARNGAMGIIPKELDGAIVTNDFPTFNVDSESILPQFLLLLTTTKRFIEFAQTCSSGTTNRQRIDMKKFLDVKIPLPPLNDEDAKNKELPNTITQEKLVYEYNKMINEADDALQKVALKENEIENLILSELGIVKSKNSKLGNGLSFYRFKDIDRWDIWSFKSLSDSNRYSFIRFRDIIIGKPVYGANVKGVDKKTETRYIRITDINEDGSLNNDIVYPEFTEEKYLLQKNDFLIARSGNTVGKTFLYKSHFGRAIYAGYLVKYNLDLIKVIPEYVLAYTKSPIFKKWVNSNQRVSGQPNINGQEYLEFPIIVPPKPIQEGLVKEISKIRITIKSLTDLSIKFKKNAIENFEKVIFNN